MKLNALTSSALLAALAATAPFFGASSTGASSLLVSASPLDARAQYARANAAAARALDDAAGETEPVEARDADADDADEDAEQIVKRSVYVTNPTTLCQTGADFVIIGGGTAGLVLANRLSASGQYTVAVLEAGISGRGDNRIDVPGYWGSGLNTIYDWNMTTQANSRTGVPSIPYPRGKMTGGSSGLNYLVADSPTARQELDAWEELGNPGWNWNSIYSAMRSVQNAVAPSSLQTSQMKFTPDYSSYSTGGPISVSYPFYISKQVQNWLPALNSLGIPTTTTANGANIGAAQQPSTIDPTRSTRSYAASGYLWPIENRSNLFVVTSALVNRIVFSSTNTSTGLKATGVNFNWGGRTWTIPVRREAIVSAGTVHSPAVLERSGIGMKAVLSNAGVQQLIELPVGENMQDHTFTAASYELAPGNPTLDTARFNSTWQQQQAQLYLANSRNPASIGTETIPSIAFITLPQLVGSSQAASLVQQAAAYAQADTSPHRATLLKQVEFLQSGLNTVGQMELIGIDGYFSNSQPWLYGRNYVTFLACQQHLLSRGNIHISSSNPNVNPTIQPNYFSAPWDLQVATAGTAYLRKIAAAPSYASYIVRERTPGLGTDLTQYTRTAVRTEYHPIGTCSMLPRGQGGVVDPSLRVYGTANVRVSCASIAPSHVSAHTQMLTYSIAERGAQIILSQQ